MGGGPRADDVDLDGGPRADDVDLEVDFGFVLGLALYLQHICVRSTSGRLVSQPRRHRPLSLHITNGTKPFVKLFKHCDPPTTI